MSRRPQCPRCDVALTVSGNVRACRACNGSWLDHEQVHRLVDAELELADDSRDPIACPVCRQPMHAKKLHGVEIDRCTKHGMWFDRGEGDKIRKLARSGTSGSSGGTGVVDAVGGILEALGQLLSAL